MEKGTEQFFGKLTNLRMNGFLHANYHSKQQQNNTEPKNHKNVNKIDNRKNSKLFHFCLIKMDIFPLRKKEKKNIKM